ncbi:Glucans biosynthesis glucosyltransferase H [Candidatus Rhodobacter oscarellae]|uniref:Glucans biosynthesis glucosyltransferase H n=1 Tax=Candidatus Rhodobacter oscarellae TaxID=1675527 RepID=A0A0J9H2M3_9RHOB|nr:glucans biosynthesis glucosyltransferase MdoH [Candidatus Rhodobacter lobularis]KMW59923.1 Glucans biosynthesis glucosyltransferase H [Candidatus Rhodobacter lobularis]
MTRYASEYMPQRAPLEMSPQTFRAVPASRQMLRSWRAMDLIWRLSAFIPTLIVTALLCVSIKRYLDLGGVPLLEGVALALVGLTLVWLVFSVNTACLGLLRVAFVRSAAPSSQAPRSPMSVALLVPVYNEAPWDVFGNASAMLKELTAQPDRDRYTLFILSDTREDENAAQEERAFAALQAEHFPGARVYYRRRLENTDKKTGNINDWIENWGAAYDAMLVLDADSLMSGPAIRQLTQALATDPDAGLIQSRPTLIGAQTLFGRVQQFSNSVYGWLLAEGLDSWSQHEGNYWGHNAIIRTRAFAESARLPYLKGRRGSQHLILSHDFVEAGMLRRAGWAVRFLPRVGGSYEETPQTLIDYIQRDRRWCHGNMQHLRLLATRGFHVISRIHLLQGALAFLMSPAWLSVVILWSFVGISQEVPGSYFSSANPLQPIWPEQQQNLAWFYLLFVYGMLLFPKLVGGVLFGLRRRTRVAYGSSLMLSGSMLFELVLSVLYAPIMMVQHTVATLLALLGRSASWAPQNRGGEGYGWLQTLRFHWVETLLGAALLSGIVLMSVSVLILPIAVSLAAAVPLSKLSAMRIDRIGPRILRLDTPHTLIEPRIVCSARTERAWLKTLLTERPQPEAIAAE